MRYARLLLSFIFIIALFFACRKDSREHIPISKSFGGSGLDLVSSVVKTADGGFVFAGATQSSDRDLANSGNNTGASPDAWIFKIDNSGQMLWSIKLGGSGNDLASHIINTADGGFVVAGFSETANGDVTGNQGGKDAWIIKLSNNGRVQWKKNFGGSGDDVANSIVQDANGDYVFTGASAAPEQVGSQRDDNLWVIKLDTEGVITWQKNFTGIAGKSVVNAPDGGYLVTGDAYNNKQINNIDVLVIKLASDGSLAWQKSFGGSGMDQSSAAVPSLSGGFVISGKSTRVDVDLHRAGNSTDTWLFEINNLGNIIWEKSYHTKEIEGLAAISVNGKGYALAGSLGSGSNSPSVLMTIDVDGNLLDRKLLNGRVNSQAFISGGQYVMAGSSAGKDVQVFTVDL